MKIRKQIKKFILALFVGAMMVSLVVGSIKASALQGVQDKVTIVPKVSDNNSGMFDESDGFWYPGRKLTKDFVIKNDNTTDLEISKISVKIESVNNFLLRKVINPDESIYNEFLKNLKVQLKDKDLVLFDGTFEDLKNNSVLLDKPIVTSGGSSEDISITVYLNETTGNIFQNLQQLFNLSIQFSLKDGGTVTTAITTLPKTGAAANFALLTALAMALIGIGLIIFDYRQKKASLNKGGNSIE
ncbi:LPXTG cell wall anchor domain-containing protein [Clostridium paridis]|uniref:LPXTG cell wall anchor domain-containing protein n=1 Tax=Clostridium paridis TaxID=2803863 RepID=A0A937K540_9CLOT|nr:LPXTG cell wall anchor domain-containing protein [Clostridium paridis]MBL4932579.1 LPXTG cell wall anchor domain-containing protein [Clostridium paridis]